MLRIAWFTTARGPGSRNLFTRVVEAIRSGGLDAEISVVFSNRSSGEAPATDSFFGLVREYGAPLVTQSSVGFRREHGGKLSRPGEPLPEWRQAYDRRVAELLSPYDFHVGVLAGYMLITTDELCERFPLLNLHPAAPHGPEGVWQDVIRRLIHDGATSSGVQIQRATSNVDRGPLVSYCTYSIRGEEIDDLWARLDPEIGEISEESPLFQEIRRRGMVREAPLMVETLRALANGDLLTVLEQSRGSPLDLTEAVERWVAGQPH